VRVQNFQQQNAFSIFSNDDTNPTTLTDENYSNQSFIDPNSSHVDNV